MQKACPCHSWTKVAKRKHFLPREMIYVGFNLKGSNFPYFNEVKINLIQRMPHLIVLLQPTADVLKMSLAISWKRLHSHPLNWLPKAIDCELRVPPYLKMLFTLFLHLLCTSFDCILTVSINTWRREVMMAAEPR